MVLTFALFQWIVLAPGVAAAELVRVETPAKTVATASGGELTIVETPRIVTETITEEGDPFPMTAAQLSGTLTTLQGIEDGPDPAPTSCYDNSDDCITRVDQACRDHGGTRRGGRIVAAVCGGQCADGSRVSCRQVPTQ